MVEVKREDGPAGVVLLEFWCLLLRLELVPALEGLVVAFLGARQLRLFALDGRIPGVLRLGSTKPIPVGS
jgi:hypothetical protein